MTNYKGIAEDIYTLLEQQGIASNGTKMIISELPFDIDKCVAIIYAPSPRPNTSIDVYRQTLDFWSRFPDPVEAYDKLAQILDILHKRQNYKTDNFHFYFSLAEGMILDMGKDESDRQLYKVSVDFMYRNKIAEELPTTS